MLAYLMHALIIGHSSKYEKKLLSLYKSLKQIMYGMYIMAYDLETSRVIGHVKQIVEKFTLFELGVSDERELEVDGVTENRYVLT